MTKDIKSVAKTTDTSLAIINLLRELDSASLQELSEYMGLAPSTVHRHIATLRKHNYVIADGNEYRVSLQFLTIGGYAQRQIEAFPKIKEKVDLLAEKTDERAQFIVEENGERVYLYTEVGETAVQTGAHIGKRGNLYTSAAGKAILANYPENRVREIVNETDLAQGDSNRISSLNDLFKALNDISERGYAFNHQETTEGVNAVGAAVRNKERNAIGALSVSGPANRVKADVLTDDFLDYVLAAVNELELYIAHSL